MQKLEDLKIDEITVDEDYYWSISSPEWTDVSEKDPKPDLGSLVDDWRELEKLRDPDQVVPFLDFDRFSAILKAVSASLYIHEDSQENH